MYPSTDPVYKIRRSNVLASLQFRCIFIFLDELAP